MGRKSNLFKKFLKLCVVVVCTTGFLLQTAEFMFLYWTYPTVVDIQVSIPSEIDLPGISFCNSNGIYPAAICSINVLHPYVRPVCTVPRLVPFVKLCVVFPHFCVNGSLPKDFRQISYYQFMGEQDLNAATLGVIRKPMSEFFTCKIVSESQEKNCSIEDAVLGSYYSEGFMPNFCFSINTLWGQPDKEIKRIKKSERIHLQFYVDLVDRNKSAPVDMVQRPKYNYPSNPAAIQLAIHSPYHIPSPYLAGQSFMVGKRYEIKLKQDEKHLLPPPYQTNCTDYMSMWKERGGFGPIDQIMVIQECKYNASLCKLGCVPMSVDYPHDDKICKLCEDCNRTKGIWDHCTDLLSSYNQPCDSINYNMYVEEKLVYIEMTFRNLLMRQQEKAIFQSLGYNCSHEQILTRRCQTVNIELVFDDFEITNVTYNPKFESLEIFSVIGGYMGMYLGISIAAVYDFAEMAAVAVYNQMKKKRKASNRRKQKLSEEKAFKKRGKMVLPFEENGDFSRRSTAIYSYGNKY